MPKSSDYILTRIHNHGDEDLLAMDSTAYLSTDYPVDAMGATEVPKSHDFNFEGKTPPLVYAKSTKGTKLRLVYRRGDGRHFLIAFTLTNKSTRLSPMNPRWVENGVLI